MNIDAIKDQAVGRWQGIYASLGIEVGDGKHRACPICCGKDRFRCDDKDGTGSWICNHCGAGDGWSLVMKKLRLSFVEAVEQVGRLISVIPISAKPKETVMTPEIMRSIFVASKEVADGDPVREYLRGRGLSKISDKLRYHPKCWEPETKKNQKAMLAVFTGADGVAVTMHRTYLDADGGKLPIESPKKILPALKKMSGGAVRLFPIEGGTLGIAEGIETALAASEDVNIPVWAALSSTLLESFEVPKGVKQLVIFADHDGNYAGQKAAFVLANRVAIKGISAIVHIPEVPGDDWLDVFVGRSVKIPE